MGWLLLLAFMYTNTCLSGERNLRKLLRTVVHHAVDPRLQATLDSNINVHIEGNTTSTVNVNPFTVRTHLVVRPSPQLGVMVAGFMVFGAGIATVLYGLKRALFDKEKKKSAFLMFIGACFIASGGLIVTNADTVTRRASLG